MSLRHSPNVVRDGLLLYVDAANTKSYGDRFAYTSVSTAATLGFTIGDAAVKGECDLGTACSGLKTFAQAVDFVHAINARLPTIEEIQVAGAAFSSGCGYDAAQCWTADKADPLGDSHYTVFGLPTTYGYAKVATANTSTAYVRYVADVDVLRADPIELNDAGLKAILDTELVTYPETVADLSPSRSTELKLGSSITVNASGSFNLTGSDVVNSRITVPLLSTYLNKLTGSINIWFKADAYSGSNGLFINRDDTTANALDWLWIGVWGAGATFYLRIGDGAACCANDLTLGSFSTNYAPTGEWHNVCCTWESAGLSQIYMDGDLANSKSIIAIPSTNPTTTGSFGLGHTSGATGSWDGELAASSIYDRVLTAAEIKQNYEALRSRFGV